MCTSFISRKGDIIIGMNFDNNGMKYNVRTEPGVFAVDVYGGRGKYPSFGVRSGGTFVNNLVVDSNGKGLYRRPSTKVTHTSKLAADILSGALPPEEFDAYLNRMEIVNTPDWSCHNMICDPQGNVWVTEPGRGIIASPTAEFPFFVMTNFSLWEMLHSGAVAECSRYQAVVAALAEAGAVDVEAAFAILDTARQYSGEWITALTMVYSKKADAVYYRTGETGAKIQTQTF